MATADPAPTTLSAPAESADEPDKPQELPATPAAEQLVEADLLVEDVSIDGMCGVY